MSIRLSRPGRLYLATIITITTSLTGMLTSFSCLADEPYIDSNRVAYIQNSLQAFSKTTTNELLNTHRYINVVDKNNCQSSLSDLRVECLLSFAEKNCTQIGGKSAMERCKLYSDTIVVNRLSEKVFINKSERYRLLKNAGSDYRSVITDYLQKKYARIVTQFSLSEASSCKNNDYHCLARALDRFCLDYTNAHSLSWQYCVSASLWFIGTTPKQDDR